MENLSLSKEPLELCIGEIYFIIDALYLNDIKSGLSNIDYKNLNTSIKENIFPYTKTPFAQYKPRKSIFPIELIKKINYDEIKFDETCCFSTDTGLILFIGQNKLIDFIVSYDYDELVDSPISINIEYWKIITAKFERTAMGLILSPGMNSGYDFDGGGTYKIIE